MSGIHLLSLADVEEAEGGWNTDMPSWCCPPRTISKPSRSKAGGQDLSFLLLFGHRGFSPASHFREAQQGTRFSFPAWALRGLRGATAVATRAIFSLK